MGDDRDGKQVKHVADQFFEIVDEQDRVIGLRRRSECHGNPSLVHRVAHVLIFDPAGRLLLQKRARTKDIQPGRWDTSVGGHLDPGEDYLTAAYREMKEELGIEQGALQPLYPSQMRNDVESENVMTYFLCYDGKIHFAEDEIEAVRYWSAQEIDAALGSGTLTPNFEQEWQRWKRYQAESKK
ncbi:MAG: NUDIX domain-containing protein [Desulfuromonadaceae bacterium]|nr:NUDIX domain-containing protein [Desulfuromonadaceae bacterium]